MYNRRNLLSASLVASSSVFLEASPLHPLRNSGTEDFGHVRESIAAAVDQGRATGVAVAVVHNGRIVWEEGFGFADRERQIASTSHTSYSLASITKAFTASLVAALAQEKKLSLDSPAMPFLKESPIQGPNGDPLTVTIRMLGAHCSGLPGTFAAHLQNGPAPAQDIAAYLDSYGHLAYPPGRVYEYSNIGYEALGALVEALTGQPFGRVLQHRVLGPLGMRDSFFSDDLQRLASAATGYDGEGKPIPPYRTSTPPSGELYASAYDLARFVLGQLRGSRRADIQQLRTPAFRGPRGISATFGWFTGNLSKGEPYYFKTGGQPGVAAKIFFLPSLDVGCVVLTNRTDAMPLVNECCRQILQRYVPGFAIPKEDAGPASSSFQPTSDFVGEWRGRLVNGGANQFARFTMRPDGTAFLALSERAPQPVTDIRDQSPGFEGTTAGLIDCEYAAAFGERTLVLKLIPHEGKLLGRVAARGVRPGLLIANLPYVLSLERQRG